MVALLTSVRNSPCFGGLRRTKTCHRQLFARPSTCFLVTFCTTQKVTIRSPSQGDSRFCKPRISAQNYNFAQAQLNPLPLCLLETWSPCSRPFAILPVSAVSDAQKLATGNFLHVRAAFARRLHHWIAAPLGGMERHHSKIGKDYCYPSLNFAFVLL